MHPFRTKQLEGEKPRERLAGGYSSPAFYLNNYHMLLLNFFVVACSLIVRMLYISFIIFNVIDDFDITILRGYDIFEIFAIAMIIRLVVAKVKPFSEDLTNEQIYKLLAVDFVSITITWGMIYIVHLIQL